MSSMGYQRGIVTPPPAAFASGEGRESEEFGARLAELFRAYNDTLVSYLTLRVQSRAEAAEVAQEAYLRLLKCADAGKIIDLKSFLFRTANNIAIDRLRRQQTKLRVLEQVRAAGAGDDGMEASTPGPETEAVAWQTLELLRAAIEELPPKCRAAFILYKLQGQSYREIAARMNLTESMVRKYVLRGLQYCHRRIDGQLPH
jgi:RNA polymerase sigma-70 factor (ECF subfamily)